LVGIIYDLVCESTEVTGNLAILNRVRWLVRNDMAFVHMDHQKAGSFEFPVLSFFTENGKRRGRADIYVHTFLHLMAIGHPPLRISKNEHPPTDIDYTP
jgi:hypothetical protein